MGEFHPNRPSHKAPKKALNHETKAVSINLDVAWLPTQSLENDSQVMNLVDFDVL